jgi:sugar phosphate isomerase/epimerase
VRPTRAVILPDEADLAAALARAKALGATHVEIEGMLDRPESHLEALADSGLFVACVRLGQGAAGATIEERRRQLERQKRLIADAARLAATVALLTPPSEGAVHFGEACALLAAFASARGIRVAVLPCGGSVVPNVEAALELLPEGVGVALNAWDNQRAKAGGRLVYVRWDQPEESP